MLTVSFRFHLIYVLEANDGLGSCCLLIRFEQICVYHFCFIFSLLSCHCNY
uniref:Uncharacterized protein n=1 Tax=Arundo donax TaxID=35708 RepID=A0A0A9FUJ1_ARUDO